MREGEGECSDLNPGLLERPKLSNSESGNERDLLCPSHPGKEWELTLVPFPPSQGSERWKAASS